ncbi:metal ABC transporter substrate-binding protein [Fredinandcohnia humi]
MIKKLFNMFIFLLLSIFLAACGANNTAEKADDNATEGKLIIYTTVFPLLDFTKKIGGDDVLVKSVYPTGADAHSFEPTPKDMTDIAEADAFIYTGVGVEGFVTTALETLKNEKVVPVEAGNGIEYVSVDDHEHRDDEQGDHDHDGIDPHIWLDPIHSITLAENIKNALVELNPDSKEMYETNFQTLKKQLVSLDNEMKQTVNSANKNEILVAHAAYGYWETRYGIRQISITGFSPSDEPSQKELKKIIETAEEHNLKYIIFEQNIPSKIAETVQKETKTESLTLHNLEAVTDKEMEKNEDYFTLMKKNLGTLKKALN